MDKIQVRHLTKIFGRQTAKALDMLADGEAPDAINKKTKAHVGVHDVNFTVAEGEILVIMGLSGSGKSTLIRCLNHLIAPTQGKILIDGQDITKLGKK